MLQPTAVVISTATGEKIPVHGETVLDIIIEPLRRSFKWTFIVAEVCKPLLGNDFLCNFGLVIDCKNNCLHDNITQCFAKGDILSADISYVVNNLTHLPEQVQQLFNAYPLLLSSSNPSTENTLLNSNVCHFIDTGSSPPTFAKCRPLAPDKYAAAKETFKQLLDMGIVQPSKSPWASPIHLVPKQNTGEWRVCGDFRQLNVETKPDKYPLPHISSVSLKLHKKCVFSKIDLLKAYHQVPMNPSDVEKTAVITPFGLFEYLYMPYGLRNAPATFQRLRDSLFRDLDFVFIYLDDILVFSESEEEHKNHLKMVFEILHENNLKVSIDKCDFYKSEIEYLGYLITDNGMRPVPRKQLDITNFAQPVDSSALRRFIGMLNFYRQMVPHFAEIVFPLTELIRLQPKSKAITWNAEAESAFIAAKESLNNACSLAYFSADCNSPLHLVTDCSQVAAGAALHQNQEGELIPIEFFSKKLSQTQRSYSTFDRELLAAYLAVLKFKHIIEGRETVLFTDHKPLIFAFRNPHTAKSDKQQRYWSLISEYISDVVHIKGEDNVVADCLSRPVSSVSVDLYDLAGIAETQSTDTEILEYKDRLKLFKIQNHDLYCEMSTPHPRPFLPLSVRKSIFHLLHNISHPGVKATLRLIKARYFWPNMDRDIRSWTRECTSCQQAKVQRHTRAPITSFTAPFGRFEFVHLDIVGPLPPSKVPGQTFTAPEQYVLTCIDRATRWLEAIPIPDISAATVAFAFIKGWVSRFGVPLYVFTDQGAQFESSLFAQLSSIIGFHRLRTTSYHPQSNGIIERTHRVLKVSLMACKDDWLASLPIVLLGLRCIPTESGVSPFTLVTGSMLLSPKLMVASQIPTFAQQKEMISEFIMRMRELDFSESSYGYLHSSSVKSFVPKDLESCTHVWVRVDRVRRPLEAPYFGPLEVIKRGAKCFTLRKISGELITVSVDRLKPASLSGSVASSGEVELPVTNSDESLVPNVSNPDDFSVSDMINPENDLTPDVTDSDVNDSSNPIRDSHLGFSEDNIVPQPVVTRSSRRVRFNRNPDYVY